MWTEVATGAEARSVRRWLRRAGAPRVIRWLVVLAIILVIGVVLWALEPIAVTWEDLCRLPNVSCYSN